MNELRAEKYRYWLVYLLDDLPEGSKFFPEDLHITIIPWFVLEPEAEKNLEKSFYKTFSDVKSIHVTVGLETSLGPREDVSVYLLDNPGRQIYDLHETSLRWFEEIGARWAVKYPFVGQEYKPHIRRRRRTQFNLGQQIKIDSIYLVRALRRADNERLVAAKVTLND